MPMQYETRIDEGGGSLSGGQRQRLAIARAVVNHPRFLLLDEATSHLDVITEARVDRNLDKLACTRLVIAHRLSTIENSDLIVVLDQGRVAEMGSHRQLLARGGGYAALVQQQSAPGAALDPTARWSRDHFTAILTADSSSPSIREAV
jgi:ABC-type bacteriocin/lantibiotic exporter with double-glycine peptidase domain